MRKKIYKETFNEVSHLTLSLTTNVVIGMVRDTETVMKGGMIYDR